jgi:hypothetical protein
MRHRLLPPVLAAAALVAAAPGAEARPGPFRQGTWTNLRNIHQARQGMVMFVFGRHGLRGFTGRIPVRCVIFHDDGSREHRNGYELYYNPGARDFGSRHGNAIEFSWVDNETSSTQDVHLRMALSGRGRRGRVELTSMWEARDHGRVLERCDGSFSTRVHWQSRRTRMPRP